MALVGQHEHNTRCRPKVVVADHKYGTAENYVACHERGINHALGRCEAKGSAGESEIFPEDQFTYQRPTDTYLCPGGQCCAADAIRTATGLGICRR